jgi:hypothetical protein
MQLRFEFAWGPIQLSQLDLLPMVGERRRTSRPSSDDPSCLPIVCPPRSGSQPRSWISAESLLQPRPPAEARRGGIRGPTRSWRLC